MDGYLELLNSILLKQNKPPKVYYCSCGNQKSSKSARMCSDCRWRLHHLIAFVMLVRSGRYYNKWGRRYTYITIQTMIRQLEH